MEEKKTTKRIFSRAGTKEPSKKVIKKTVEPRSVKDRWIEAMIAIKAAKDGVERRRAIKSLEAIKKELLK